MNNNLKFFMLKIIYDKLNLKEVEEELENKGVMPKNIKNDENLPLVSNYFFLKNDIHLDNLTAEELTALKKYYDGTMNHDEELSKALYQFLDHNMLKLLLLKEQQGYISFGDQFHMAPADAIILDFHYRKYTNEDFTDEQDEIVSNELNKIQYELGPKAGIKVAVLKYDELLKNNYRI